MFFQQFLWRNRQGFAKEKTVSPLIEDSILKETARAFLNSDLNVTTAAEKLGIHRNTLLYRLNRIEVETGIDLKRFDDAAGYYFSEMLDKFYKIVKEADLAFTSTSIQSNRATSKYPRSVILSSGMTGSDRKLSVIKGSRFLGMFKSE